MDRFRLKARDKPGLFVAMAKALIGNAHVSFEGDLARCGLVAIPGAMSIETAVLKRNTRSPIQDFVVLPLESGTISAILAAVLPGARIVHDVEHVQIERKGQHEFGAFDNFHPKCVGCGSGVPRELLDRLLLSGVLRSWELVSSKEGV